MSGKLHSDNRTVTAFLRSQNIAFLVANRWFAAILILLASLLLFSLNLERPPHPDELYHILAARGLLESGEPRIAEGLYVRAYPFTWIVAQSFALFGESLATARLPSVVATALLVAVLFLWLWREIGQAAAWIGAGLYAISPFAVLIAQFSRFYAIQTLVFTLGIWLVYDFVRYRPSVPGAILRLAVAAALFAFGVILQPTTLIGLVALSVWLVPILLWRLFCGSTLTSRSKRSLAVILTLGIVAFFALAYATGLLELFWHRYRAVPLFNSANRDRFWFYHAWYVLFYPTFWTMIGFLALFAWAQARWLGSFATSIFAAAFLLNSFAGPKSLRYIAYVQPLLFVIWGIALAAARPAISRFLGHLQGQLATSLHFLGYRSLSVARLLIATALLFLLLANPFWLPTVTVIADIPVPPEKPSTDWRKAAPALAPWLGRVEVVVDTTELGPLYFLGRHDILYGPSKFGELPPDRRRDFGRDVRTGRPVIGSLDALERVFQCYRSGLFLAPESHLGLAHFLNPDVLLLLDRYTTPLALPAEAHVLAWTWERDISSDPSLCASLPRPPSRWRGRAE